MAQNVLRVKRRIRIGKSGARKIRKEGNVPAILYGKGEDPIPLIVNPLDLKKALSGPAGKNTLLTLEIEDNGNTIQKVSLLRDTQIDPITRKPIHFDFHMIHTGEQVHVVVPIHIVGRAEGVKLGGILEEHIRELDVECLPSNIPSSIEVDVTSLGIGNSIHVGDLNLPEGVKPLRDPEDAIVTISAPTEAEEGIEITEEEGEEEKEEGSES